VLPQNEVHVMKGRSADGRTGQKTHCRTMTQIY